MKAVKFLLTICLILGAQSGASAQKHESIMHIRAQAPSQEVTLLDLVKSEDYERSYSYNEYGYITSVMVKRKSEGVWELDTDDSYIQDFTFDANGVCTSRTRYAVDASGQRAAVTDKAEVEKVDGITWQRFYDSYDGHLYLDEAYGYDQWGNLVRKYDYDYDYDTQQGLLDEVEEWGYMGPLPPMNHYYFREFEDAYRTYHLRGEEMDGKMKVRDAEKTEIIKEKDRVIRRTLKLDDNNFGTPTLSNWEQCLETRSEDIYYLNADGTRPIKLDTYYYSYYDHEMQLEDVQYYEWDDLGRLTRKYSNFSSDACLQNWEERFTYADNSIVPLSLDDIILRRPSLYPEEIYEYQLGGRPINEVMRDGEYSEESVIEYENGKLVKATWKELRDGQEEAHGTMYFFYNVAGHLAYYIDEVHEDGWEDFYKKEHVYDERGTWIGWNEYDGESLDGPWNLEYSTFHPYEEEPVHDRVKAHRIGRQRHQAPNISDMSDGKHFVDEDDGVWRTWGMYVVEDGKIVSGEIEQTLVNNASRPVDPETYYTDPVAPLECNKDDLMYDPMGGRWHYVWIDGEWILRDAPSYAQDRYYQAGEGIVRCDTYNREQQITSSRIYYKDAEGRLVRVEDDGVTTNEYTYLPGTNYIDTHVFYGTTRKYYYSIHNYVDPSGIKTINAHNAQAISKHIEDGRIIIMKDGVKYGVNGQRIW